MRLAAARLAALLLVLCWVGAGPVCAVAAEIRVALPQLPITLDPRFATDAASVKVQQLLHRGLVRLDDHFRPQPDLAESWRHPDPRTWRFTLRAGLRFHDGSPVTAEDVAATLSSILDPRIKSPLAAGFAALERVRALDRRRLEIRLRRVDASLLTRLVLGVLPARLAAGGQEARTTIGCGPYRLAGWRGNRITLAPRDHRRPVVTIVRVKDPVTRALKLARGEIDLMQNDFPLYLLDWLRRRPHLRVATRPSTTFSYIGINLHDPILKRRAVRRALALAVDRRLLKRALFGDAPVLAATVLPADHWATAKLAQIPYDPERARRLLDRAGFPPDADGIRFHLNWRTSTDPERLRLAVAIAAGWRRIGVEVSVESLEWGGFYARIKRGDFQLYSLSWVGIVDPDIYRWILHSSMWPPKGANRGRYRDPEVDRWLDRAATSEDRALRRRLYARVERRMLRDLVYIPLWYEPVVAVWRDRIRGFAPRADGSLLPLLDVRPAD
ncbi:MAG: ABC transporter substrate-binding protein [Zetaproteobacteria bacterium]|nr:MAG: ABC transporter substrate-binding protein [Zetaproteobacteria bacterium]